MRNQTPVTADRGTGGGPAGPGGTGRPGPRAPRRHLAGAAWLIIVLVGALLVVLTVVGRPSTAPPARAVVASLPYWNIGNGTSTVLAHRKDFTEVSPWMYGLTASGQINTQYSPGQSAEVNAKISQLRQSGLRIVPTLANITAGRWAYQPVARMLHDPTLMAQHVSAVVALVQRHHYAGIDIDYENLHAGDRQAFATFVTHLAAALHAKGKTLSVALFAKTTNAGVDQRNIAQNYAAIGRAADQVRLMTYDYHWGSSAPGAVAPVSWVRAVVRYAKTQMPASKIILGIPLYGYDWTGGHGRAVSWLTAFRLARQYHAHARYDTASQSPWFSYTDKSGHRHQVWFENPASSTAKFGVARGSGVGGIFLWMYGYEDTGTWAALHSTLPPAGPGAASGGAS